MMVMPFDLATKMHDYNATWAFGLNRYDELALEYPTKQLTEDQIFSIGYKSGFAVDHVENEETGEDDYGFQDQDGNVDNEPMFKFVRLIEKEHGIGVDL